MGIKRLKYVMTLALICVLGVLMYYYFTNRDTGGKGKEEETIYSQVDKVLSKDLDEKYPLTAREVVSFFVSIQKCYYNEDYTDEQLMKLAVTSKKLFDDELNKKNKFEDYYSNLTAEIEEFKSEEKKIVNVLMDKASEITYYEEEGIKYAKMNCIYYVKSSKDTTKVKETYILRCSKDDQWKILGWGVYTPSEYE